VCVCVCLCPNSLSVAIIFLSYIFHVRYMPFLDFLNVQGGTLTTDHVTSEGAVLSYSFSYNRLESMYLVGSMFVLLSGMVFESSYLIPGSISYDALTYLVRVADSTAILSFRRR
jgi:hypothetical protein